MTAVWHWVLLAVLLVAFGWLVCAIADEVGGPADGEEPA